MPVLSGRARLPASQVAPPLPEFSGRGRCILAMMLWTVFLPALKTEPDHLVQNQGPEAGPGVKPSQRLSQVQTEKSKDPLQQAPSTL